MFEGLALQTFTLIDDMGHKVIENATFGAAKDCKYGCGIFVFRKPVS
jgi:hypothetical protein